MTRPSARTRANRRNALKSTGPKTAEGKARVATNARVHGFCGSKRAELTPRAERLARMIAGADAAPERLALALEIAVADDMVRRARLLLESRLPEPSQAYVAALIREDDRMSRLVDLDAERLLLSKRVHKGRPLRVDNYPRFRNLAARLAAQMQRWENFPAAHEVPDARRPSQVRLLARYEDDAMRRRARAIRAFDAHCGGREVCAPAMDGGASRRSSKARPSL